MGRFRVLDKAGQENPQWNFSEYYSAVGGDKEDVFEDYAFYSGMPLILSHSNDTAKAKGNKKIYIQSAFALPDEAKTEQELKPFSLANDYFPKIIIRKDIRKRWYNDDGILNIGLIDFLLDDNLF